MRESLISAASGIRLRLCCVTTSLQLIHADKYRISQAWQVHSISAILPPPLPTLRVLVQVGEPE
jgi:hypothetical protein